MSLAAIESPERAAGTHDRGGVVAAGRCALFGAAPAHSPWLYIYAAFARQAGVASRCEIIAVTAATFSEQLDVFFAGGGIGASVDAQIAGTAATRCRVLTVAADRAGVADTLSRQFDGSVLGDNAAGDAVTNDLCRRRGHDLRDRRTLLLGAGTAGLLPALVEAGVGDIAIAHRDHEPMPARASGVGLPGQINSVDWDDLSELGAFDLIVNGRAASGERLDLPLRLIAPRALACDLDCGPDARDFIAWAQAGDAEDAFDGLGILADRAAAAFRRWHGMAPHADAVIESMRDDAFAWR